MRRKRPLTALSIFFAALPLAFAVIRAVRTGDDFRYLWVALAAVFGAAAVLTVAGMIARDRPAPASTSAAVFVIATLVALVVARLLGTTIGPGILIVAASFACCFSAGCLTYLWT